MVKEQLEMVDPRFAIADFNAIEPVRCPCGWAKRAFAQASDGRATFHVTTIEADSRTHYHKRLTEIYYVLEGEGVMELDGESHRLKPGLSVLIKPGCRHRAVGKLTVAIVALPAFDADDEWFDE